MWISGETGGKIKKGGFWNKMEKRKKYCANFTRGKKNPWETG